MNVLPVGTTQSVKARSQLAQVCQYLQHRPIALFDSEYGCAPLVKTTAAIAADKLMRIRSNRCLWSTPQPIVVKVDPKFTVNSLSSTTLKAGGNQNKPSNLLNPNSEKFGP